MYRKVESWCIGTAPPISGCLQMTMLCSTSGLRNCSDRAMALFFALSEAAANGGDSVCRACPILLIARVLGLVRFPAESKASVLCVGCF